MANQGDNKDPLLEKLDGLMRSGRARKKMDPPPLLTDAIPSASESTIPTLMDAVEVSDTVPQERRPTETAGIQADPSVDVEQAAAADAAEDGPLEFHQDTPSELPGDTSNDSQQGAPVDTKENAPLEFHQDAPGHLLDDTSIDSQQGVPVDAAEDAPLEFHPDTPGELPGNTSIDSQEGAPVSAAEDSPAEPHEDTLGELSGDGQIGSQHDATADLQDLISSRLVARIDNEIASLLKELPGHGAKLAVLHRSIRFALPELVRLRWQEPPNAESDTEANGTDEPGQ